jgi:hypothetical protein
VPSLKKLACRFRWARVESLPIPPDAVLSEEQKARICEYNKIDVLNTARLLEQCRPQLQMREELSRIYNTDLRSSSDAQIAERVIASKVPKTNDCFDGSYPRPLEGVLRPFEFETAQLRNFWADLYDKTWIRIKKVFHPIKRKHTYQKFFERGFETFGSIGKVLP